MTMEITLNTFIPITLAGFGFGLIAAAVWIIAPYLVTNRVELKKVPVVSPATKRKNF